MPQPLKNEALNHLKRTLETDRHSTITLLPYRIFSSLKNNHSINYRIEIFVTCGLLSLYGWMAYSIYDRIIDGKEIPLLLPLANIFHREMLVNYEKIINRLTSDGKFKDVDVRFCNKILDSMDCAELCESRARLKVLNILTTTSQSIGIKIPSKKQTVEKSIGFLLPCIFVLSNLDIPLSKPSIKKFVTFFRHYIFIKQLSDDMRDWKEDDKNKIITRVTARFLRQTPKDKTKAIQHALLISAKEIRQHSQLAKNVLLSSAIFRENSFLFNLIDRHEKTAKEFLLRSNIQIKNKNPNI